jgi:hypothetical protein
MPASIWRKQTHVSNKNVFPYTQITRSGQGTSEGKLLGTRKITGIFPKLIARTNQHANNSYGKLLRKESDPSYLRVGWFNSI